MRKRCSLCGDWSNRTWPLSTGGRACDSCKFSVERCEGQKGGGGHEVAGCFSQPFKSTKRK